MPNESTGFWYGKRVLITGGDGFVASHLAVALMEKNANVVIVVRHQRPIATIRMLTGGRLVPDVESSDLSSSTAVQKLCHRQHIDTVFHLAGSAIVSHAWTAPLATFENNIVSTLNILEAARLNKIPRVLIASSDKCYGDHAAADDPEKIPYVESQALRGGDVYSTSKACADLISQTYACQFQVPIAVIRSCNVYGPGDLSITRLIPRTILRLLLGSRPVVNEGNAHVLREFIYVEDVVRAYEFLAEGLGRLYKAEVPRGGRSAYGWAAFNVGSYAAGDARSARDCPNIRSVRQIIAEISARVGRQTVEPIVVPRHESGIEIPDQYLDSSKLLGLGFRPQYDLKTGLERTIDWYRKNAERLAKLGHAYLKDD